MVIPVGMGFVPYAREVKEFFRKEKMWVDIDVSGTRFPRK